MSTMAVISLQTMPLKMSIVVANSNKWKKSKIFKSSSEQIDCGKRCPSDKVYINVTLYLKTTKHSDYEHDAFMLSYGAWERV